MEAYVAEQRIKTALHSRLPPATKFSLVPGQQVLLCRDTLKRWVGPYKKRSHIGQNSPHNRRHLDKAIQHNPGHPSRHQNDRHRLEKYNFRHRLSHRQELSIDIPRRKHPEERPTLPYLRLSTSHPQRELNCLR